MLFVRLRKIFFVLFLASLLALGSQTQSLARRQIPPATQPSSYLTVQLPGALIYTAERNGRWDLFAAASNRAPARITREANPARGVSVSREGSLAFASENDGNWEIYTSALDGSNLKRLTNGLAYDGEPAWSPDAKKIAFESLRADDLDIWVMDIDGKNPTNLTASNAAYDFDPAWSPDSKWIAYTSVQNTYKQIFVVPSAGGNAINLSKYKSDDEQPAWSPNGKLLAFVSDRDGQRAIYVADVNLAAGKLENVRRATFFGWDFAPAFSPDGQSLAFISTRPNRQTIYVLSLKDGARTPRAIDDETRWVSSLTWTDRELPNLKPQPDDAPLVVEKPVRAASGEGHPYEVVGVREIYLAPSYGNMASRVSTSLLALRERVKSESGIDFLGQLSDMTRQLVYPCKLECDILSWHKTGRAVDTLWTIGVASQGLMEFVREEQNGELYWRIYLRAAKQDGTMGEPLKDFTWDLSEYARTVVARGKGGMEKPIPIGYYLDFTELAREYGWTRIPSADDPDFDWREDFLALEYWHYEKRDGLTWYQAIREIFSASDLTLFGWENLVATRKEQERYLYVKDIPPPPSAWKWYTLLP